MANKIDDQESKRLEEAYRINLKHLRPHILNMCSISSINHCRIWLEKMEKLETNNNVEKKVRNSYLMELSRQLQNGKLEMPFSKEPPKGPLQDLPRRIEPLNLDSDSWSDMSEATKTATEMDAYAEDTQRGSVKEPEQDSTVLEDLKEKNNLLRNTLDKCIRDLENNKKQEDIRISVLLQNQDAEWLNKIYELRRTMMKTFEIKVAKLNEEKKVELDKNLKDLRKTITDSYEMRIAKLKEDKNKEMELKYNEIELRLKNENEKKMKKLLTEKDEELQEKIEETKKSVESDYEKQFSTIKDDVEKCLQAKDNEIKRLQVELENQCQRLHEERQLPTTTSSKEKEQLKKIEFLQNYILKLEKLFKKYEQRYAEKIESIKRDLTMKENVMQIQLMTQNAQTITQCRCENQLEIELVIDKLENKYRRLLEEQMHQIQNVKYLNKIDVT